MKDLVEFMAKSLVDNPDEVSVDESQKYNSTILKLTVSPDDMGKIIGKNGKIAKAVRTIVKSASRKRGRGRVMVDIGNGKVE